MPRAWKAEKKFVLDCPICREPALPQQVSDQYGKNGFSLIHPGRIAPCFVKEGTDAFESVRTDFNGAFGRDVTSIATQARTGRISDDSGPAERRETFEQLANTVDETLEAIYRRLIVRSGLDTWENEGGACAY